MLSFCDFFLHSLSLSLYLCVYSSLGCSNFCVPSMWLRRINFERKSLVEQMSQSQRVCVCFFFFDRVCALHFEHWKSCSFNDDTDHVTLNIVRGLLFFLLVYKTFFFFLFGPRRFYNVCWLSLSKHIQFVCACVSLRVYFPFYPTPFDKIMQIFSSVIGL